MKKRAVILAITLAALLCVVSGSINFDQQVAAPPFEVTIPTDDLSESSMFLQAGVPIIIGALAVAVYVLWYITGSDKMSRKENGEESEITILRKQVAKQSRIMSIMYFMQAAILVLITVVLARG